MQNHVRTVDSSLQMIPEARKAALGQYKASLGGISYRLILFVSAVTS